MDKLRSRKLKRGWGESDGKRIEFIRVDSGRDESVEFAVHKIHEGDIVIAIVTQGMNKDEIRSVQKALDLIVALVDENNKLNGIAEIVA